MKTNLGNPDLLSRRLSLFSDPLRLRLFLLLFRSEREKLCVSELAAYLGASLSNTSHQLKKLALAGMVEPVRRGRMVCYRVRKSRENKILYNSLIRLSLIRL